MRGKRRQQASLGPAPCLLDPHTQWLSLQENLKSGENTGLEVSENPKLDQRSLCAPVALFLYVPMYGDVKQLKVLAQLWSQTPGCKLQEGSGGFEAPLPLS